MFDNFQTKEIEWTTLVTKYISHGLDPKPCDLKLNMIHV